MTPPSLISYTETTWNSAAASKTTASISWNSGDVLVCLSISEGSTSVPGTPTNTGSGLTWADQKSQTTGSNCCGRISTAVASATSSGTVTVSATNSQDYGFGVWVWRGSDGVGNSAISSPGSNTSKTISLTPTAADSGIVWGVGDFNADAAATAGTPAPTNTRQKVQVASHYTIGVFDLTDQTSAGAVSYGFTGGGSTGPFLIFAVEVKGTAGGGGGTIGGPCFDGRTFRGLTNGRVLGAPMSREARMMAEADGLYRQDRQLRRAA